MAPTATVGERVYGQTSGFRPKVGEIVVLHPPKDAVQEVCGPVPHVIKLGGAVCAEPESEPTEFKFLKRIVAGPGDTIAVVEGHVIRNGQREADSYTKPCGTSPECNFPTPVKVPAGDWFMMGDNRGESDDSRFWGPVPTSWIVGVVRSCGQPGSACAGS
jgi:signal peptidase I